MECPHLAPLLTPLLILTWSALCAFQDARQGLISHWLVYPAMVVAVLYITVTGHSALGGSGPDVVLAVMLALALTLPGYARGHFGAGDVKMLLVLALASGALFILLLIAVAALGMALWSLGGATVWARVPKRLRPYLRALTPDRARQAYGPFLLLAVISVLTFIPRPLPGLI